jgi:hypothetical protein
MVSIGAVMRLSAESYPSFEPAHAQDRPGEEPEGCWPDPNSRTIPREELVQLHGDHGLFDADGEWSSTRMFLTWPDFSAAVFFAVTGWPPSLAPSYY